MPRMLNNVRLHEKLIGKRVSVFAVVITYATSN